MVKSIEYNIEFYEDTNGKQNTTWQLIKELENNSDKHSRNLLNSIYYRLQILKTIGTRDGMPNFRQIKGSKNKLWELRIKHTTGLHRVFICAWNGNTFVILNHFLKKSPKTPPAEIKLAENLMNNWINNHGGGV